MLNLNKNSSGRAVQLSAGPLCLFALPPAQPLATTDLSASAGLPFLDILYSCSHTLRGGLHLSLSVLLRFVHAVLCTVLLSLLWLMNYIPRHGLMSIWVVSLCDYYG